MLAFETIAVAQVVNGCEFVLSRRDTEWCVRVGGRILMSSSMHDSEESLAAEAIARVENPEKVLVGGLGLGFTLRAVLERVSATAQVTVGELVPELVDWNRQQLAELHDHALDDPRCQVVVGDVFALIKRSSAAFDVILLDVDNGPIALSHAQNQQLYGERGLRQCHAALRAGGMLAVWSAGPSPRFQARLTDAGFDVEVLKVPARQGNRARHVLFLAKRR
jgi:spermidine synthase